MEKQTEKKPHGMRPGSQMEFIVNCYRSGITTTEGIAIKLQDAVKNGQITGLKKTDAEAMAKKDLSWFKKTVNWYLNQAKHKEFINAPLSARRRKKLEETVANAAATLVPAESAPAAETTAVADTSETFIPTI